ncbi:MAG TPA: hypothetical protein PLG57_12965 [Bacteroidia bacterium]|jgi:hypothetical protein|nr:hypothetical protein [Bacteroidia bacterium]HQK97366.1 hypothetical protein [Bacteroidia bacterium]
MKKLFYALAACFLLFSYSCKDDLTAFSFTHDYAEFEIEVDPTTTQGNISLGEYEVSTNITNLLKDNGASLEHLKSVTVKSINLAIDDSSATPYTFNLVSKINAKIGNTNSSSMIDFAKKDPVPSTGLTAIDLDMFDTDLLGYFRNSNIKFNLSGFTNAPIDHAFKVKVKLRVQFEGDIIK